MKIFCFLGALKANLLFGVRSDVWAHQQRQLHLYIYTLHPESWLQSIEPIFAEELIFNLYMKHIFNGVELCQM